MMVYKFVNYPSHKIRYQNILNNSRKAKKWLLKGNIGRLFRNTMYSKTCLDFQGGGVKLGKADSLNNV